jgi:hypothetical protein
MHRYLQHSPQQPDINKVVSMVADLQSSLRLSVDLALELTAVMLPVSNCSSIFFLPAATYTAQIYGNDELDVGDEGNQKREVYITTKVWNNSYQVGYDYPASMRADLAGAGWAYICGPLPYTKCVATVSKDLNLLNRKENT